MRTEVAISTFIAQLVGGMLRPKTGLGITAAVLRPSSRRCPLPPLRPRSIAGGPAENAVKGQVGICTIPRGIYQGWS